MNALHGLTEFGAAPSVVGFRAAMPTTLKFGVGPRQWLSCFFPIGSGLGASVAKRCDHGFHFANQVIDLVLAVQDGVHRVLGRDVEEMLSLLILMNTNLFVAVPREFALNPMDDTVDCVEIMLSISYFSGDIIREDVHEHPK